MSAISPEILELLACPVPECRGDLRLADATLLCDGCGRRYRLEERWPVLIPEEAQLPVAPAPGANVEHSG